jgi:hypothetical protein
VNTWYSFYGSSGLQHVFIDSDNNAGTGWITSSNPTIGADYVIENGTLYKYAGSGNDWTWTQVDGVTPSINGYTITWTIPLADITNRATTQKVVFEGNGFAPTAYSNVITLVQGITITNPTGSNTTTAPANRRW